MLKITWQVSTHEHFRFFLNDMGCEIEYLGGLDTPLFVDDYSKEYLKAYPNDDPKDIEIGNLDWDVLLALDCRTGLRGRFT